MSQPRHHSTTRGFARASGLVQSRIRSASQSRGFAVSRVLTHWTEVAGAEIAAVCRPVEVSYGRQGMGATLVVLTTGAQAPMLEMQKGAIMERVNAAYGYRAITRIRITQTAPTGFAEGQARFAPQTGAAPQAPPPEVVAAAQDIASGVTDDRLRLALESLAARVLAKRRS